jgi:hypothetical protein
MSKTLSFFTTAAIRCAEDVPALLEALYKAKLIEGYAIEQGKNAGSFGPCYVSVTCRERPELGDGYDCPSGSAETLEAALSLALRGCPGEVQEAAAPALLRWSIDLVARKDERSEQWKS